MLTYQRGIVLIWGLSAISSALAVDGVIEINQARALAGNVTPGDTAGFPVTLSRTGSYRLTGNLATGSRETSGLVVIADGVTVDLNGFTIACAISTVAIPISCIASGVQHGSGVYVESSSVTETTVRNGVVRDMGDYGVNTGVNSLVEGVKAVNNGGRGIRVSTGGIIRSSIASGNKGTSGFMADGGCLLINNTAVSNDGDGFNLQSSGCTLIGNTAFLNTGFGIKFFLGAGKSGFEGNVVTFNNGSNSNVQVVGGREETGSNVCGLDTNC